MLSRLASSSAGRAGLALLALLAVVGVGFVLQGGRAYVVSSPSMGQAAPVGTLLVTRPVDVDRVDIGSILTFHNPIGEVYSHRVVGRTATGLTTRGDINSAPDAWTTRQDQVIGSVFLAVPAVGLVLRGIPLTILIAGILWLLGMFFRPSREHLLRLVRVPLAVAATIVVLHPWVAVQQTAVATHADRVEVSAVSTGLMPSRLTAAHPARALPGGEPRVVDGQVGTVRVHRPPAHEPSIRIDARPDLDAFWWVLVVLICLSPLGLAILIGMPRSWEPA